MFCEIKQSEDSRSEWKFRNFKTQAMFTLPVTQQLSLNRPIRHFSPKIYTNVHDEHKIQGKTTTDYRPN